MRLLVTGGAGYIGSVVARVLVDEGHEVVVADDLSSGHEWLVPEGATFSRIDLTDRVGLSGVVTPDLEGVLHFAARSLVGESVQRPELYFRTNVGGTLNLLDAMREAGVSRLVFSSTAAVYGEPAEIPITEEAPAAPTNPYGASKLAVDHMIAAECAAHGVAGVSLRYFNVAGAMGRQGEAHDPETHLIPIVLAVAAGAARHVSVYGSDYPTPDGTAIRDYIHVSDLARAHVLALEAASPGIHRVYNLGNQRGYSVREVIDAARDVTGKDIPAMDADRRPGDPPVLVASSEAAGRDLGWVPRSGLRTMIEDAWRWMNDFHPHFRGRRG